MKLRSAATVTRPHRTSSDHSHRVAVFDSGSQRGMYASGHGLNGHRGLVAHLFGYVVELALVGDELGCPASSAAFAEPCLQSCFEVAAGEVSVVVAIGGCGAFEGQREASGGVTQHRFDQYSTAIGQLTDDLMSEHKWERDEIFEVAGRMAVDGCQIAAADARETGPNTVPSFAG